MKLSTLGLIGALAAGVAFITPAKADVILTFGQSGGGNTIVGTATAAGTTWGGTDIPVTVTQIQGAGAPATPFAAFLDVSAASTDGAITAGVFIVQSFAGTFSINSLANNTGTNFLSGTFNDGALTADGAVQIVIGAPDVTFLSDVITTLGPPDALGFSFTNVTPPVSLVACATCDGGGPGQTIASFTASVAGNAAAFEVPEPTTLALFGASLLGLGLARRRRKLAA